MLTESMVTVSRSTNSQFSDTTEDGCQISCQNGPWLFYLEHEFKRSIFLWQPFSSVKNVNKSLTQSGFGQGLSRDTWKRFDWIAANSCWFLISRISRRFVLISSWINHKIIAPVDVSWRRIFCDPVCDLRGFRGRVCRDLVIHRAP